MISCLNCLLLSADDVLVSCCCAVVGCHLHQQTQRSNDDLTGPETLRPPMYDPVPGTVSA